MPHHASDETLAAFADGRLRGRHRQEVIEHAAECDECRDILNALAEAQEAEVIEKAPVVRGRFGWVVGGLAAVAAALTAVAFLTPLGEPVRDRIDFYRTGGVSELVKTSHQLNEWPLQTRLSGFAVPAKLRPVYRGPKDLDLDAEADKANLQFAQLTVLERANKKTVKGLHAIGLAHLLNGERAEAVAALEEAEEMQKEPDPALLNDLAAAYLDRQFDADRTKALATAEKAWKLAKTPESTWNLAKAYEWLNRRDDAIHMYREYLKLDATSAFAQKATSRIEDLSPEPSQP